MQTQLLTIGLLALPVILVVVLVMKVLALRRIVPTNVVHIVQQGNKTVSYGVGKQSNVYYKWPTWLPVLGVEVRELPVSNFDVDLHGYDAYDKDRLPFMIDIKAFFGISDTNKAAEKVASFNELVDQLQNVVRGAVRSILANEHLDYIMQERAEFGKKFTEAVNHDLANWGVVAIKSIELMDIRDTKESQVIHQIMQKKMSQIEAESRIDVARNKKNAQEAELESTKEVNLKIATTNRESEEALAKSQQAIGIAKAQSAKESGIAEQESKAQIAEAAKKTAEKEMEVTKIKQVRKAEIDKESAEILAEQNKRTATIKAEADKSVVEINAEATLSAKNKEATGILVVKQREAEGISATGLAEAEIIKAKGLSEAEAKKQFELASVIAQTTLAKEVGTNKEYQAYLIELKKVDVSQVVGVAQAQSMGTALAKGNLKLLVNAGDVHSGLNKFSDLFSSKGASQFNGFMEALGDSEEGKKLVEQIKSLFGAKK